MEAVKRTTMFRLIGTQSSGETGLKACTTSTRSAGLQACHVAIAACLLALVTGCSSKPDAPQKPAPTYTLRQVTLPDLSHAAASVQRQLRDGYASLQKKLNGAATPNEELGLAYGQMGMLLMASEFRGEAESALLNAQTFTPR